MKNILIDSKRLQQVIADIHSNIGHKNIEILKNLKDEYGIEFIMSKDDNIRALFQCVVKQILNEKSTYTYKMRNADDNPFLKGEIVKEWLYFNMNDTYEFLKTFETTQVDNSIRFFNLNNNTEIKLREIVFDNANELMKKYSEDGADKEILKQSKQIQKAFDGLYMNKTVKQQQILNAAIMFYLNTLNFQLLHNYLVKMEYYD